MAISRRTLLRRLGAGAAVAATAPQRLCRRSDVPRAVGARRETIRTGEPIRLNRNENAYGPSAHVMAAIRDTALTAASRYPDVEAEALRRKIAGFHRVAPEQVVLGCGSSEILRMAIDAFVGPQKKLVAAAADVRADWRMGTSAPAPRSWAFQ